MPEILLKRFLLRCDCADEFDYLSSTDLNTEQNHELSDQPLLVNLLLTFIDLRYRSYAVSTKVLRCDNIHLAAYKSSAAIRHHWQHRTHHSLYQSVTHTSWDLYLVILRTTCTTKDAVTGDANVLSTVTGFHFSAVQTILGLT